MNIIGFVGASGTGKSYRSMWLAKELGLEYIIDDGLLISHHKIVEGVSAKKEKTKMGAVKRALFMDEMHRVKVTAAIRKCKPDGILVLGTSVGMVERIVKALELPEASRYVMIEDIASEEEIALAGKMRREQGKHVIPVPTLEIKEAFSGYFVDPLRIFKKRSDNKMYTAEKSIVRPSFSYLGDFKIYDNVLCRMCAYEAERCEGVYRAHRVTVYSNPEGVDFTVDITAHYGCNVIDCARLVQESVKGPLESYTSLNIRHIHVNVIRLHVGE
ncbi:MAG: hypothetical protein E7409_07015 [Ruminococcaceae bacterium]|nr:hypothetical protein [Oscillospiraceae bacterium]